MGSGIERDSWAGLQPRRTSGVNLLAPTLGSRVQLGVCATIWCSGARRLRRSHSRLAGVAQLVEQLIRNQQVLGSSPSAGSNDFNGLDRARRVTWRFRLPPGYQKQPRSQNPC